MWRWALGVGWWAVQDRIRRQSAALKDEVQKLQSLPLRIAEAKLKVTEAELGSLAEVKQKNPTAVSDTELRQLELRLELAKLDLERSRAKERFGSDAER